MKNKAQYSGTRSSRHSFLFLGIACLLLPGARVFASKQAPKPKQYIFSRSVNQTNSNTLELTGVPAYVNFPDGSQKCGVYVTQNIPGGVSTRLKLVPGTVLVSINNQTVNSPSAIDSMLSGATSISFSYVKMVNGLPKFFSSASSLDSSGTASFSGIPGWMTGGKMSNDKTPLNTLESHMLDLLNQDRRENGGLPPLSSNSRLVDLARKYAEVLLVTHRYSHVDGAGHNPVDRARQAGIVCQIRENLAEQPRNINSDMILVEKSEKQMMNEPPHTENHRGNILCTNGKAIGIGIARDANWLIMVQEISDTNP